jgi:hypothetical protein
MAGRVGEGQARPRRQILDAALALPEVFEQLQAMRMAERLRDLREARKYVLFWAHT